jgi:hypothetical protein
MLLTMTADTMTKTTTANEAIAVGIAQRFSRSRTAALLALTLA